MPFVGPEAQERARGKVFAARLGANESVFGPSPKAVEAIAEAAKDAWMYGDPEIHDLKFALAEHHDVAPESILVGEGVDSLLGLTCRLTLAPGASVITGIGSYPTFNYHAAGCGARLRALPYRDDRPDIAEMAMAARRDGARLFYLANPDNPTGGWHEADAVRELALKLPADCLLLLDEAYIDCAPDGVAPPIDTRLERVLRFRTFSKAYGLAGLRVGYAIGNPDLIRTFDRIRNHFGLGRVAQAGALAALQDREHHAAAIAWIRRSREQIGEIARKNGLKPLPSAANFVAVDCGGDGVFAKAVMEGLLARDVFVRMPGAAPIDRCIRVSCGREADLALLADALPGALEDARASTGR